MGLRFCMLEDANGGQVAINVGAVVAVGVEDGHTVIVHQGGQIPVEGVVGEVVLKLLAVAVQQEQPAKLKTAA